MQRFLLMIATLLLVSTLYGCGDSNGWQFDPKSLTTDAYVFPTGKTVISFSAAPTSGLPVPISAVDLTITLPSGMSVTTSGAAGQLDSATVLPGSALGGTNLAYGSYAEATRTVQLSMATTSSSYNGGEFLKLYCSVPSGAVVTLGNLRTLNAPVVVTKAVGYDPVTQSTVTLTDKVAVTLNAALP